MNNVNDNNLIYRKIASALQSLGSVEPALLHSLPDIMEGYTYTDFELMLSKDHVCQHVWYIVEGYIRWFQIINNREVTMYISKPADLVLHAGFYNRKPSPLQLQALKNGCQTQRVNYDIVKKIQQMYPSTYALSTVLSSRLRDQKLAFQNMLSHTNIYTRYLLLKQYLGDKYFNTLTIDNISPLLNIDRSTLYRWLHK